MNSLVRLLAVIVAGDNVDHVGGWTTSYTYIIGDPSLSINGGAAFSGENTINWSGSNPGSSSGSNYNMNSNDNSLYTNSPYSMNVEGTNYDTCAFCGDCVVCDFLCKCEKDTDFTITIIRSC